MKINSQLETTWQMKSTQAVIPDLMRYTNYRHIYKRTSRDLKQV